MTSKSRILFCENGPNASLDIEAIKKDVPNIEVERCEYVDQVRALIADTQNEIQVVITAIALPGKGTNEGENIFLNEKRATLYFGLASKKIPVIVLSDTLPARLKNKKVKIEAHGDRWILREDGYISELVEAVKRIIKESEKKEG